MRLRRALTGTLAALTLTFTTAGVATAESQPSLTVSSGVIVPTDYGSGNYWATAKCQCVKHGGSATGYVKGRGRAKTAGQAEVNAKRDASNGATRGYYVRHCKITSSGKGSGFGDSFSIEPILESKGLVTPFAAPGCHDYGWGGFGDSFSIGDVVDE